MSESASEIRNRYVILSVSHNRPADPEPSSTTHDPAAARDWDQQHIARALAGDAAAFDDLVRHYAPRLTRMAYGLVGNHEDAEDLAQEALSKAYFKLDSFAGRSSFFTWVYRITVNLSISKRRKRRLESTHQAVAWEPDALPPEVEDARSAAETREQVEQLRQAITCLPEDRRAVLVLRDLEELSYDQIAELLEIPKGTVRSRLHRAREELRQLIEVATPDAPPAPSPNPASAAERSAPHQNASQPRGDKL